MFRRPPLVGLVAVAATATAIATSSAPTKVVRHFATRTAHVEAAAHAGGSALPTSVHYALESNGIDGGIARWNPCAPIPWQVNLTGAPRGALRVVSAAVHRVALASGLRFRYVGTTS